MATYQLPLPTLNRNRTGLEKDVHVEETFRGETRTVVQYAAPGTGTAANYYWTSCKINAATIDYQSKIFFGQEIDASADD
jgi:hypothetical protein